MSESRDKPIRGRPQVWPTKITAPPLALELYALIGKLQKSDAFTTCHIYHGTRLRNEPMVKFEGKATSLPYVVGSYMGLPHGTQQCDTPGCCNPFHYLPNAADTGRLVQMVEEHDRTLEIGIEEWADLIDYEADNRRVRVEDLTVEMVRPWIPVEDLSDEQLKSGLEHLKST